MDTAVEQVNRDDADRVKQIFADALELDAAEAASFVARACGDDADLRAKVEALLSAHVAAGRF